MRLIALLVVPTALLDELSRLSIAAETLPYCAFSSL